jgi:hypothetical protein
MFVLTTENIGDPLAIFVQTGKPNIVISIIDTDKIRPTKCCKKCIGKKCHGECCNKCRGGSCGSSLNLNDDTREFKVVNGYIQLLPNTKTRDTIYIAGKSGSGKSTWISKYLALYKEIYPENPIYLFSRLDEDDVLDQYKPIRMTLNDELVNDPIDPDQELSNSLCIFDDTDTIKDKKIKGAVNELKNDILEIGRHENIFVCIVSHLINNYKETRTILNESMYITFFPSAGSPHGIKYMLKNNMGLDKKQIERIMSLPSRWVTIKNSCPLAVLYEKGIYLL